MNTTAAARRRHPWRDTLEGLLSALALVLVIRHFAFEVFKIPTGSMAPTLLGQHRDIHCPNCGYAYTLDGFNAISEGSLKSSQLTRCPNCWYPLSGLEVSRLHCSCLPSWPQRLFWRGGNRVIVNKFLSRLRAPRRWDVVVFKWPYTKVHCIRQNDPIPDVPQGKPVPRRCPECGGPVTYENNNYIKRLVGLPGEELFVWHGDIYVNGRLARKPPTVQEAVWQHVYDSRHAPASPVNGATTIWFLKDGRRVPIAQRDFYPRWSAETGSVQEDGARLLLTPDAAGAACARYAALITDYAPYNYWDTRPLVPVGDLRWTVDVSMDAPGALQLGIEEDGEQYVASIGFGKGHAQTTITAHGKVVAQSDFAAEIGKTIAVSFANADDALELKIDGKLILAYDIAPAAGATPEASRSAGAWLACAGARADFARVRLQRDLYYTDQDGDVSVPAEVTSIPAGRYYVMGDNTRNSSDSRMWGTFPEQNLIGIGSVVWWPLNQIRPCW